MEKIDIVIATVALFFITLFSSKTEEKYVEMHKETDSVPQDIKVLKRQNVMLTKELVEKSNKKDSVIYITNTQVVKPKEEFVYLRIDGVIHEVKFQRDEGTGRFIIDVDSLTKIKEK